MFKDMFKGFQDFIKEKKKHPEETLIQHKDPSPILSADQLLATEKRHQSMGEIRGLLNLPDDEFERVFLSVTENFAEFVQNLPETERNYYANTGGMLDHALERASLSLYLCRTYLMPEGATLASVSESEMLWVYALYTAALFYDIGKIATDHIITLTDVHGKTIKSWLPYKGPMTAEKASHYVYGFSEEHHDHMRWKVTPILAVEILQEGFHWIASDNDVLESWLSLLSDEYRQVSPLLTIIQLVEALLQEGFYTGRKFRNDLSPQSILALNKIAKDRKELAKQQKELKEKMLAEQADKNKEVQKQDKDKPAEKTDIPQTHEKGETKSATKQASLFSIPISPHESRRVPEGIAKTVSSYMQSNLSQKELIGKFIDWLKQNESLLKDSKLAHAVEKGALIDQKVMEKFISDTRIGAVTVEQIKQALVEANIAMPADYMAVVAGQQTGRISGALQFANPFLVFYTGIPPLNLDNIVSAMAPLPQASPQASQVQTAHQDYMQNQAEQAKNEARVASETTHAPRRGPN